MSLFLRAIFFAKCDRLRSPFCFRIHIVPHPPPPVKGLFTKIPRRMRRAKKGGTAQPPCPPSTQRGCHERVRRCDCQISPDIGRDKACLVFTHAIHANRMTGVAPPQTLFSHPNEYINPVQSRLFPGGGHRRTGFRAILPRAMVCSPFSVLSFFVFHDLKQVRGICVFLARIVYKGKSAFLALARFIYFAFREPYPGTVIPQTFNLHR